MQTIRACTFYIFVGSDYSALSTVVRIFTGRDVTSFFIYARNDRILEYDESFVIFANPPLTPADGNNCNATVTILDNDGEYTS